MNDNKELNDNLQRLFSTIKDAYGIASMIKDFKEKEVVKSKDFKILSIIYIGNGCKNIVNGEDIVYIPPNYSILKVERLSDNQEFEIGMETDEGTIKEFYISENILWVRTEEKGGVVSINDIQKVKRKDYEIVSVIDDKQAVWAYDVSDEHSPDFKIFSVRRKSDNEVFSIGDKTIYGVIESFKDLWSGLQAYFPDGCGAILASIKKVKERTVLFITEDNVPIHEGDRCWYMTEYFRIDFYDFNVHSEKNREHDLMHYPDYYKYFSTEDKAKIFVEENQPKYSKLDMKDCFEHAAKQAAYGCTFQNYYDWLINVYKQKINNQ